MQTSVRKWLSFTLALVMVLVLAACGGGSASSSPAPGAAGTSGAASAASTSESGVKPIKIAVFLAQSGIDASSAVFETQDFDLLVEDYNARGGVEGLGGAPIELVYCDTMSDPNQMKTVVANALQDEEIAFALFPLASSYTNASIAALTKAQVPSLTTSRSDSSSSMRCI